MVGTVAFWTRNRRIINGVDAYSWFMGTVIPIILNRIGFDPATTAGPFETAFQDVIGFSVFLWLASLLLLLLN